MSQRCFVVDQEWTKLIATFVAFFRPGQSGPTNTPPSCLSRGPTAIEWLRSIVGQQRHQFADTDVLDVGSGDGKRNSLEEEIEEAENTVQSTVYNIRI
jgi:hypothetical protein